MLDLKLKDQIDNEIRFVQEDLNRKLEMLISTCQDAQRKMKSCISLNSLGIVQAQGGMIDAACGRLEILERIRSGKL